MKRLVVLLAACFAFASCGGEQPKAGGEKPVVVMAAASLTDVMKTIGDQYEAAGHPRPRFSFAGTSDLARQVEQGAEASVFISADEKWMNHLAERDLIDPATRRTLLTNTLVLIAPAGAAFDLKMAPGMDLAAALKDGKLTIASPESVPAGRYAKEALEHLGAWEGLHDKIASTDDVRAALRFVEAGEAAAGIVYWTDAKAAGASVVVIGTFPADSHTPVTYPAAVLATAPDTAAAQAFLDYLSSEGAKKVFAEAGFGQPKANRSDRTRSRQVEE